MSNILVMNLNYVKSDFLTGQTKSSELTAAPATNVYDKVRRTKTWRTQGYWEITAANKGIVLQEVITVNQTVNIAEGTYATDALFFAAVKAALDSASGSAVYTVTRDVTTNKIKITSDGAGGAILSLMCTNGSFTAATTLGFSTSADLTGALTYTADVLKIHTSEWLRWDCGTSVNPQAFAMCGPIERGLGLSSSAVVTLQGNATDTWASPSFEQVLTWNMDCISLFDTAGLHTSALRYWRLKIVDPSNPLGYIEISKIYLGEVYEATVGTVQFPFDHQMRDLSDVERSKWGTAFSNVRQVVEDVAPLNWSFLTTDEKQELEDFVREFGTTYPFWICLDPQQLMATDLNRWVRPFFFSELPRFSYERPDQWSSSWNLIEEA